jgi:hypothetical protein
VARDYAQAKALLEFWRHERPSPLVDEDLAARNFNEFIVGRRLHAFTGEDVERAAAAIQSQARRFPNDPFMAGIPGRFAECVRRQANIEATGRQITKDDRLYGYDLIRIALLNREIEILHEQTNPTAQPPQRSEPLSFQDYTTRYHQINNQQHEEAPLSPEMNLLADVIRYITYVEDPAFRTGPREIFESLFYAARHRDILNFDFIPNPHPGHLVQTFREFLDSQPELHDAMQVAGNERIVELWLSAITAYGHYLENDEAATEEHLWAFTALRWVVADNDRRTLNESIPQQPETSDLTNNLELEEGSAERLLTFHQWVVREYAVPTHIIGSCIGDVLEAEMNGYVQYLQQNGTDSEVNVFQRIRTEVNENPFDYLPEDPLVPAFSTWRETENERRRGAGIDVLTDLDNVLALELYEAQIDENGSEEEYQDFIAARLHHYEENRRQMYGHTRHEHSVLIERLRDYRAAVTQLIMNTYQYWGRFDDPVREGLRAIISLLNIHIAMEREPSEEHWGAVRSTIADAEQLIEASEVRAWEGNDWRVIQEPRAQIDTPMPGSSHDSESETELESPTRPRRDFFAPYSPQAESESDDDIPFSLSTF